MNKVEYGLCKSVVFPIMETAEDGTPRYGDPIILPGSIGLQLDAKGDAVVVNADNIIWWQTTPNMGYDGSLTNKTLPDRFYTEILRETVDSNGVYIENADAQPREFAYGCQFEGDEKAARRIFYRVSCGRPSQGSNTKTEKMDTNDIEIKISVSARLSDHVIKAKVYSDSPAYENFFKSVYEPQVGTQVTESFTGDGTKTDFVLSSAPSNVLVVYINGVLRSDYTVTSKTVKFATAPAANAVISITYLHA